MKRHIILSIIALMAYFSCFGNQIYISEITEIQDHDNDSIIFDNNQKGHRSFDGYCELSESNISIYGLDISEILLYEVYNSNDHNLIGTFSNQDELLSLIFSDKKDITIIFHTLESAYIGRFNLSSSG